MSFRALFCAGEAETVMGGRYKFSLYRRGVELRRGNVTTQIYQLYQVNPFPFFSRLSLNDLKPTGGILHNIDRPVCVPHHDIHHDRRPDSKTCVDFYYCCWKCADDDDGWRGRRYRWESTAGYGQDSGGQGFVDWFS